MSHESPSPVLTIDDIRHRATITVDEYAALVGVSRATAYIAVNAGEVPSIRVGRRLLVTVPALLRALGDVPSSTVSL